jgi:hypothetical protein
MFIWTSSAYDKISAFLNEGYLSIKNKSNMRQLSKAETADLEFIKLYTLVNLKPMTEITNEKIKAAIVSHFGIPKDLENIIKHNKINTYDLTIDDYKKTIVATYTEYILSKN